MNVARAICLGSIVLLAWVVGAGQARAELLNVSVDWQGRQIQLPLTFQKPQGAGPFAVVILLPGCSAELDSGLSVWANQLHSWGYATLLIEGTAARGLGNICNNLDTMRTMGAETARDVFRAAHALAGRPDVKPNKIAVLGRSLGSNSIVWFVTRSLPAVAATQATGTASGTKVVAAVAITPNCDNPGPAAMEMPLLILAGALDDWNTASRCADFASAAANASLVHIKIYPGAYHGYDRPGPPGVYYGHHVEYNVAATQDSYAQTRSFLGQYLQ